VASSLSQLRLKVYDSGRPILGGFSLAALSLRTEPTRDNECNGDVSTVMNFAGAWGFEAILQQPSGKLAANFGLFAADWECANDEAAINSRLARRGLCKYFKY
jgi:hypothetical protein